jgi:heme exporter protein A
MKTQTGCSTTLAHDTTSDPTTVPPRLKVSELACRRGNEWLFRGLSFSIHPGEMLWLRGSNGSGKTTLLRTVAGLSFADEGHLEWGTNTSGERVVYVGHLNAMKDDLTVCEALQFMAGLHDADASRAGVLEALRQLGMHHRRHTLVRSLSQGQRRRVALARLALEQGPALWILDEPFDALDLAGIEAVNRLLLAHLDGGGSILLTSHTELHGAGPVATELALDQGHVE